MPLKLCKNTMYSINDDGKVSNDLSTNSKSINRFNCKSNHMKIIKRERLSGGADNEIKESVENSVEATASVDPTASIEPGVESTITNSENINEELSKKYPTQKSDLNDVQNDIASGPCCICATHLISDSKIKEIIDYAHQNLQDAGKALATLGENFEHGLKLAIVDVLGRIQQWSITVQNKLDICKGDIDRLQAELLSQICAINDKENKIKELNKQIADLMAEINRLKQQLAECIAAKNLVEEERYLSEQKQVEQVKKENPVEEVKPVKEITENTSIAKNLKEEPIVKKLKEEPIVKKPKEEPIEKSIEKPVEKIAKVEEPKITKMQTREKDKERKRREMELESEIGCLRKENERLMKEKIDYENAIQRALLRGVSSLNVEALRVLRCPPIPCCSPCAPCPMSFIPTNEETVPCPAKMKRACSARPANKEYCNRYRNGNENENGKNWKYDQCDSMIKQLCASPCCPAGKNRQNSDNSMYFLLHQGDAENVCRKNERPPPRPCGSPVMKKIEIPPCSRYR
ncbi:centrosomal protein POC5-like [Vespula squamosa]|uniref:Centrosomal protein POC5-like n=1 Tax=Vespula squamosa TaxID=30214 RepID=A0ABD2AB98_VESSQ